MSVLPPAIKDLLRPAWRTLRRCLSTLKKREPKRVAWIDDLKRMAQGRNLHLLFDVGANNGLTTRVFVENFPGARVRAFEPIPEVAGAARKRHEGNPHVTVECLALDECSGKRVFRVNSFSETSSFLDSNRLLQSNGLWLNDALSPHAGRPLDGWENQLNSRVSGVNPTAR